MRGMNIIAMRQEQRAIKISQIQESIKKTLSEGNMVNYKELVLSVKARINLSDRIAKDYIQIALYNLNLTEKHLEDPLTPKLFKIENGKL